MPRPCLPRALRSALALCALLLGTSAPQRTTADETPAPVEFGAGGLYGSAAIAYASDHFGRTPFGDAFRDSLGFDARVGYRAGRAFAAEFEVELHGFDFRQAGAGGVQVNSTLDTMVWTANLKGFLLPGRFQPFLQAGAGVLVLDAGALGQSQNDVGAALRFGAGLDAHLSRAFALTTHASYVLPLGVVSAYDYYTLTAGIQYTLRFAD